MVPHCIFKDEQTMFVVRGRARKFLVEGCWKSLGCSSVESIAACLQGGAKILGFYARIAHGISNFNSIAERKVQNMKRCTTNSLIRQIQ